MLDWTLFLVPSQSLCGTHFHSTELYNATMLHILLLHCA
jgi:hypothetical protein